MVRKVLISQRKDSSACSDPGRKKGKSIRKSLPPGVPAEEFGAEKDIPALPVICDIPGDDLVRRIEEKVGLQRLPVNLYIITRPPEGNRIKLMAKGRLSYIHGLHIVFKLPDIEKRETGAKEY